MTELTNRLWSLLDTLFPPSVLAALAVFVVVSSIAHVVMRKNYRALWFVAGALNFVYIYIWIYTVDTTSLQRSVAIRFAYAMLLIPMAVYNEQSWPWLSRWLKRTLGKLRKSWGDG